MKNVIKLPLKNSEKVTTGSHKRLKLVATTTSQFPSYFAEAKHLLELSRILQPNKSNSFVDYFNLVVESEGKSSDITDLCAKTGSLVI